MTLLPPLLFSPSHICFSVLWMFFVPFYFHPPTQALCRFVDCFRVIAILNTSPLSIFFHSNFWCFSMCPLLILPLLCFYSYGIEYIAFRNCYYNCRSWILWTLFLKKNCSGALQKIKIFIPMVKLSLHCYHYIIRHGH